MWMAFDQSPNQAHSLLPLRLERFTTDPYLAIMAVSEAKLLRCDSNGAVDTVADKHICRAGPNVDLTVG